MNTESLAVLLGIAVIWPLLLSMPALHTRLPWPRYLAIVPAALLTLSPGAVTLALPWLLLGTEFSVDGDVRWILAMTVIVWLVAATITRTAKGGFAEQRTTTYFMLTLSGHLGVVFAADLVGFYGFALLMGYGFYALLIQQGDEHRCRAGRRYLIFLIVADLLLFEALLLAAVASDDLRYHAVQEVMAGGSASSLYLWMVVTGFALKVGIWPAHLWLMAVLRSANSLVALLLGGAIVAMSLVGAARWLPLGGYGLDPALYPILATMGVLLALFAVKMVSAREVQSVSDIKGSKYHDLTAAIGRRVTVDAIALKSGMSAMLSRCCALWLMMQSQYPRTAIAKIMRRLAGGWSVTITLFVLLGLLLTWLAG